MSEGPYKDAMRRKRFHSWEKNSDWDLEILPERLGRPLWQASLGTSDRHMILLHSNCAIALYWGATAQIVAGHIVHPEDLRSFGQACIDAANGAIGEMPEVEENANGAGVSQAGGAG